MQSGVHTGRTMAAIKRPDPYQQDIDMARAFEGMLRRLDANEPDDVDSFVDWAQSEPVRAWVLRFSRVDMSNVQHSRTDYFCAPLFVAYHMTCETLQRAGRSYKNAFLKQTE